MKTKLSHLFIIVLAVFLFSCIALLPVATADQITVVGQKWLPFIGEPGTQATGFMTEVVRSIFEKEGHKVEFIQVPQKRANKYLRKGKYDILLGIDKNDAPDFIYPEEELGTIEDAFFIKRNGTWRFNGIESLKNVSVGILHDSSFGGHRSEFLNKHLESGEIKTLSASGHFRRMMKMLLKQRLDVIIETPQVVRWGLKVFDIDESEIEYRGSVGTERPIHVAFSPAKPKSEAHAETFSKGIVQMRENGELKAILDKYNQKDWKPTKGKVMDISYVEPFAPISLDPPVPTDIVSFIMIDQIYDGLVRYKDESTSIEPALAVAWEARDNDLTWIFSLRRGVKFHDGTIFNAKAVLDSFNRQIDPAHPFYRSGFSYAGFTFKNIKKVEAIGDYSIKISLEKPYAPFLYNMAMPAARIISPAALKKYKGKLDKNPVGTGPFIFQSWDENNQLLLARNKHYYMGAPFIRNLKFSQEKDSEKIIEGMKTGKYNVCGMVDSEQKETVDSTSGLGIFMAPVMRINYMMMNTEKKPFDNPLVRRAINFAINKPVLVNEVFKGFSMPAKTPLPPSMWGYNKWLKDFEYSPKLAKILLARANLEKGFEMELLLIQGDENEHIARIIKKNLASINVKVKIKTTPRKTYFPAVKNGLHHAALGNWIGDNGDPDNFLYVLFDYDNAVKGKATNRAFYKNDELHEILIKAQRISSRAARTELYEQAQAIIHADAPWVCLYHSHLVVGRRDGIRSVIPHPTGIIRFYRAWIDN